jgi:hypothetical protein
MAVMKALIAALASLAIPSAPALAKTATWQAFADCAAAYQVNAQLKNPDRPASMTASISEQSNDYRTAALATYRAKAKQADAPAERTISTRIARQAPALARLSRDKLEHRIDACPQLPDQ